VDDPGETEGGRQLVAAIDEATDVLTSFVVPLYVHDNGRPSHLGSGFFIKAGTTCFLVSAAHVLEIMTKRPLFHYVTPTMTRTLTGELRLNRWEGDREKDPVDVGVLKLRDSVPPYPDVHKYPMDISYLRPRLLPRSGKIYTIIEFPASRTKVNPVSKQINATAYAYRNRSAAYDKYHAFGVSPDTHVVLPLDLKDNVDSSGRHRNFPRPQGMSGSPISVLVEEEMSDDSRVFPVVAVATKYLKSNRAILATDIEVAARMINEAV
jgi:hypothetical protein